VGSSTLPKEDFIMIPEGLLLEVCELGNGLSLFIYDQSRPVAGDRWFAKLLFHVPVKVKPEHIVSLIDTNHPFDEFTSATGGLIAFQCYKHRNFIDQSQLPGALAQLKAEFFTSTLPYVSRPDFEAQLTAKRYLDWREQRKTTRTIAQRLAP
jgi:hypothetical protein